MSSVTPGFLTAASSPAPLQDDELDDFLGDIVAGVTGLNRTLVRPRWQEEPANMPARDVTWAAVGVMNQTADTFTYQGLATDGTSQTMQRHETVEIRVSFYGPLAGTVATAFRDGLQIPQNNEQLMLAGFGMISTDGPERAPELIKTKWLERADIVWRTRRQIDRVYPVLSLLSAHGTIYSDRVTAPFDTLLGQ